MTDSQIRKIFKTPPLGEISGEKTSAQNTPPPPKSQHESKTINLSPSGKKPSTPKSSGPKMTDIPALPAYRVSPLGRGSGSMSNTAKWRTEAMRSHSTPTFLWFTRGQGRITVSGVTRGFGPHNLIYLPTRTMYGFEPVGQVMGHAVHLPDDTQFGLPQQPLHMRFRDVIQQNEVTGMIETLQREIDQNQPGRERALAFHAGLFAVWLERQINIMPDYNLTPDASRRLAAAFTALVENELYDGGNVAHFAAELGVTPGHLSRACNIACGRSASAILADRVHFEARRMLSDTDMPVRQIAEKLGFHSAAYFSRAFHKQTGRSPRDFRLNG